MIVAWQYLIAIVLISAAYPLGRKIGRLAHDEIKSAEKYLFLLRDSLILAVVAIACYSLSLTVLQYALPAAIIISFFWLWHWYETIYPFLIPVLLFFSRATTETFLVNATLLFLAAYTSASLAHKRLKTPRDYSGYWPVPVLGALLSLILVLL